MDDEQTVKTKEASYRAIVPGLTNEMLVSLLSGQQHLIAMHEMRRNVGLGFSKANDEQYRLTAFALEQEILKRLQEGQSNG